MNKNNKKAQIQSLENVNTIKRVYQFKQPFLVFK